MSQQLAIKEETITRLDEIATGYQLAKVEQSPFKASIATAVAINELRSLLTPAVMKPIMALMNSPIGFLTDRSGRANWKGETKPLYTEDVIKDVVIEATLRGFYPVGNEFNVIADRFYAAKNGLRRKVSTFPGLTEFKDTYSVPRIVGEAGATVDAKATWKFNGAEDSFERTFAVKGDKYAGADSYVGKATRKLLAAVLERISGVSVPDGEAGEVEMKPADAHEVDSNDPHEQAMAVWRADCEATETYNAKLKAQGIPEDQWEPLPPMPVRAEANGGNQAKEATPEAEPVEEELPWQEVVVTQFRSITGKKLGELDLEMLVKIRDTIMGMSASVRRSKGLEKLITPICAAIKELTPVPEKATPLEGLRNLMQASGVTEKMLIAYLLEINGQSPGAIRNLSSENAQTLIDAWPDVLKLVKG